MVKQKIGTETVDNENDVDGVDENQADLDKMMERILR
jgi:hypothetical protein